MSLLHVENLCVDYTTPEGTVRVVDRVSLKLDFGEVLGIIGESGSGKSVLALAIMELLSSSAQMTADLFMVEDQDVMKMAPAARREFLSSRFAIIFQEPTTSLNPNMTIGRQLDEAIRYHQGGSRRQRHHEAIELLASVGLDEPESRLRQYPHELSGGMNQRVMIAMAVSCRPRLLIADEPTTALDVTIQAQILDLLLRLNRDRDMALILITHDFAILSETTDIVDVMYCGQIVESGRTGNLLRAPRHPYTRALLDSVPQFGMRHKAGSRLFNLRGATPPMRHLPVGCYLGPRCPYARKECVETPKLRKIKGRSVRCHFPLDDKDKGK